MGAVEVPAVGVGPAGGAALRALVLVPAAHPGRVGREPRVAGAAERAHRVGAGRLYPAVRGAVEESVLNVALIDLVAGGLVHVGLAVVAVQTVLIRGTARHLVPAPVVVLVAHSVAAVVGGGVAKTDGVVGIFGCGEVLGVQTEVVPAPRPPSLVTVRISLAVALALSAGMLGGAPPLTTVILLVPAAPGVGTVVSATDHGALTARIIQDLKTTEFRNRKRVNTYEFSNFFLPPQDLTSFVCY